MFGKLISVFIWFLYFMSIVQMFVNMSLEKDTHRLIDVGVIFLVLFLLTLMSFAVYNILDDKIIVTANKNYKNLKLNQKYIAIKTVEDFYQVIPKREDELDETFNNEPKFYHKSYFYK